MGRVKQSRLNSTRTRVRVKAHYRAGLGPRHVPVETPAADPMFRLRQMARKIARQASQ